MRKKCLVSSTLLLWEPANCCEVRNLGVNNNNNNNNNNYYYYYVNYYYYYYYYVKYETLNIWKYYMQIIL
jgi:hypothetical protein